MLSSVASCTGHPARSSEMSLRNLFEVMLSISYVVCLRNVYLMSGTALPQHPVHPVRIAYQPVCRC